MNQYNLQNNEMNKNLITGKMLRNKKGKRECNLWWLVVVAGGIEASFKNVKSLISIVFPVFYSTVHQSVECGNRVQTEPDPLLLFFFPPLFIPAHRTRTVLYSFDSGWWMMGALGSLHWNGRLENKNKKKEKRRKWICRVQPYRSSGFQHLASKTPRRLIRTSLNNTHKIVSSVAAAATGPVDRGSGADITSSVAIRPEERRKCYPLSYCIAVHNSTRHGRNEQNKKKKIS